MGTFLDGRVDPRARRRAQPMLPAEVERLLTRQHDVVHWRQLRAAGLSRDRIVRLIDAGVLRRLPGRVLTTTRGRIERDARRWSAILATGPGARLASHSALALLGIATDEPHGVHTVVAGSAPRPVPGVTAHRTTLLPIPDMIVAEGFPSTATARSLVDAAADSSAERLDAYLDRAVMLGRFDGEQLARAQGDRPHVPGSRSLRLAIDRLDASTGRFRSEFERRLGLLVRTSSLLGAPRVNVLADGYRPDFWFPGTSAIVECDGRDYHRSMAQILADAERELILLSRGFTILRLRWAQVVYEPERTLARIEQFVVSNAGLPEGRRHGLVHG